MAHVKTSCLPTVLKEYMPEYEPFPISYIQQNKTAGGGFRSGKQGGQTTLKKPGFKQEIAGSDEEITRTTTEESAGSKLGKGQVAQIVDITPTKVPYNDDTLSLRRHRKSENQRYEQISENWDHALLDLREKHHQCLKEKIELQHDLIYQQDLHAKQCRDLVEQEHRQGQVDKKETKHSRAETGKLAVRNFPMNTKQRESEKARRRARDADYKEICRQSLENDKKTLTKSREDRQIVQNEKKITVPSGLVNITAGDELTQKKLALFESALPSMCETPPDFGGEDSDVSDEIPVGEGVPWHHSQLYRMYGKKADYFLHPKLEPQAKRTPNPNVKRYGDKSGADALWEALREESMARLIAEDKNVPQELKAAYSAFVRQSMRLNRKPVKRNYYAVDDVPEMDRLLDQSQVRRVRTFQHKTDLMFRASQSNKDRTNVLLYNNPLPDVVSKSAGKSIDQYLPSWSENASDDSIPEYQKWLRPHPTLGGTADEKIKEDVNPQTVDSHDTFDTELMLMVAKQKPGTKPKYIFLTEEKATCKGQFTQRLRQLKEGPRLQIMSHSAMNMSESTVTPDLEMPTCKSAPLPAIRDANQWQPLSMNALTEYKMRIGAPGEGDFGLGRPKMYSFTSVS